MRMVAQEITTFILYSNTTNTVMKMRLFKVEISLIPRPVWKYLNLGMRLSWDWLFIEVSGMESGGKIVYQVYFNRSIFRSCIL